MSKRANPHYPKKLLSEYDYSFKILFLGGIGVGKTSIINRYVKNILNNDEKPTIGIDYKTKDVIYNSKKIKLKIFDTSGQERFRTLTKNYYHGSDGIIMVFDLKRNETFEELTYWMEEINKNCDKDKIELILVGNKNDGKLEERKVTQEQGNQLANLYNFIYIETSAITNLNIKECFDLMVHSLFEKNIKNNKEEIKDEEMKNINNNNDKNEVNKDVNMDNIILDKNNHLSHNNNTNYNNSINNNENSCCNG